MKVKELIKKLQEFPQDAEVCLMDYRKNLFHDGGFGDGTSEGIYPNFVITTDMFTNYLSEEETEFVVISFENEDYTSDGHRAIEVDVHDVYEDEGI